MQVAQQRQAQGHLQHPLARRVVGQIFTTHHVGDALRGVVHHHRELVRPQPIGALEDEVAHGLFDVLRLRAQAPVHPSQFGVWAHVHAPSPCVALTQATLIGPTGARVHRGLAALGLLPQDLQIDFDLAARTRAGVGQTHLYQLRERRLIGRAALALPPHGLIADHAASGQLRQDALAHARFAAHGVDVFDAHQPRAVVGAGIEPTRQRRHQRARVQWAGG